MVTGFKEQTHDLTDFELQQVHFFLKSFKQHIGRDNKITSSQIEMHYKNLGKKINGARIRAIVHYIRYQEKIEISGRKHFLISDNNGYWLSNNKAEIEKFANSLEQRAGAILSIKQAVDKFLGIAPAKQFLDKNQAELF